MAYRDNATKIDSETRNSSTEIKVPLKIRKQTETELIFKVVHCNYLKFLLGYKLYTVNKWIINYSKVTRNRR